MKIVCLGDSLTQGYGVSSRDNWVSVLNAGGALQWVNKGISGDTTAAMLARFEKDVVSLKPDYVFILGGVNDFIMGDTVGAVMSHMMSMMHQAYSCRIQPIAGVPFRIHRERVKKEWAEVTNYEEVETLMEIYRHKLLRTCQAFHTPCIDLTNCLGKDTEGKYLIDGLHPTKEGHRIAAEQIGEEVLTIIDKMRC